MMHDIIQNCNSELTKNIENLTTHSERQSTDANMYMKHLSNKNDKANIRTRLLVVKENTLRKEEVLIRKQNILKSTIFFFLIR